MTHMEQFPHFSTDRSTPVKKKKKNCIALLHLLSREHYREKVCEMKGIKMGLGDKLAARVRLHCQ